MNRFNDPISDSNKIFEFKKYSTFISLAIQTNMVEILCNTNQELYIFFVHAQATSERQFSNILKICSDFINHTGVTL